MTDGPILRGDLGGFRVILHAEHGRSQRLQLTLTNAVYRRAPFSRPLRKGQGILVVSFIRSSPLESCEYCMSFVPRFSVRRGEEVDVTSLIPDAHFFLRYAANCR